MHDKFNNLIITWITLFSVLFFAAFAPGTMLAKNDSGSVGFIICTGEGLISIVLGEEGNTHPVPNGPHEEDETPCDWAQLTQGDLYAPTASAVLVLTSNNANQLAWLRDNQKPSTAPREVHARGPPIFV